MPPISNRQIAKHLGVKPPLITRWRKAGMPADSLEAAIAWHRQHVRARKSGPARRQSEVAATDMPGPPPEVREPIDRKKLAEEGPEAEYERQKNITKAAYVLVAQSLREGRADVRQRLGDNHVATKNWIEIRQRLLDLMERERRLVSGEWVKRVMQEHDGIAASLARSMPKQLAGRISPHDPEHAEAELERWVQDVFLKTLSNTDPWTS